VLSIDLWRLTVLKTVSCDCVHSFHDKIDWWGNYCPRKVLS